MTTAAPVDAPAGTRRRLALALVAAGMALVTVDGSAGWAVVRVLAVVALCWGVERLDRPWVDVAVGAIAATAGATIGFSHLTTTGASVRAAGGLLAFGAGLALLIRAASVLLRRTHGWRRWLAVPIGAVVVYAIVVPVWAAVYATNVPRPALGHETPADVGLPYVDAGFTTRDGVALSGWYVPSANGAAVALLHGASSTRTNVLRQAAVLARHGYGVLLFDARGHGRSGGRAMDFGWYGDDDVGAAVGWLTHRPDVEPGRIGVVGMSMGGEEAIGAMASDRRIAAVVAEGATNRAFADKAWLPHAFGVRGRITQAADWLTYSLADVLTEARPPTSLRRAVAVADRPVLLITAGKVADEGRADEWIRSASPSTVDVWTVTGADHIGGLGAQPAAWEQRVTAFLDANLSGA